MNSIRSISLVWLGLLMLETDAPYLTPVPKRGEANEPGYLALTAAYAAKLFGVGLDDLARITTANARSFFGPRVPV